MRWSALVFSVGLSAVGSLVWTSPAHAQMTCAHDSTCTAGGAVCGGDVCSHVGANSLKCVAASTGDPGWCTANNQCKCRAQGATCDTATSHCTFTMPRDGGASDSGIADSSSGGLTDSGSGGGGDATSAADTGDDGGGSGGSSGGGSSSGAAGDDGGGTGDDGGGSSGGSGSGSSSGSTGGSSGGFSSSGSSGSGGSSGAGATSGAGGTTTIPSSSSSSGCACTVGSNAPSQAGLGAFALVGCLAISRRRMRS